MIFIDFRLYVAPEIILSQKKTKKQNRWKSKSFEFYTGLRLRAYKHHKTNIFTLIDDEKKYIRVRKYFLGDQK